MKRAIVYAALIAVLTPHAASAATLTCDDLPIILAAFRRNHYLTKDIDPQTAQRVSEQLVRQLDPSRTTLLEADVVKIKQDAMMMVAGAAAGRCPGLDAAASLLVTRAEEDEVLAKKLLGPEYKLDETVELQFDPDKRGWAKTPAERAALVTKMIHFQMSQLSTALKPDVAKKQLAHRYELVTKRLRERREEGRLPELLAESVAASLDPHSSFMSADDLADFRIQMQLSLEGIGAALRSEDGFTVIESLVPGGQADKSQMLQPKDKIISVSQEGGEAVSTIDMDLRDVVKMIRGKKGTKVKLMVLREGDAPSTFEVTIVRDKIDVKQQAAQIRYVSRTAGKRTFKVGILDLPSFYGGGDGTGRSSYADVKKLLEEARKEKADAIVLDLSQNGGGLLEDAVRISGLFMRLGSIVATKDTEGEIEKLEDEDPSTVWGGPLAVMVSPASASASEILAGALQSYRRALIVGSSHTFGKGTVQAVVPLPRDLGAIKVTTGMFFLPSGLSTQQRGVGADVVVPTLLDGFDLGERTLDYSLPPQSVPSFTSADVNSREPSEHWSPIDPGAIAMLATKSKDRIAKNAGFVDLLKEIEEAKSDKGPVKLSELRKKAKANGEPNEKNAKEKREKMELTFVEEGVDIIVDYLNRTTMVSSSK